MARKFLLGGGLAAVLLAAFMFLGSARQPAQAQPAAAPAVGRYQISTFVIDGQTPGAYILDTQTGTWSRWSAATSRSGSGRPPSPSRPSSRTPRASGRAEPPYGL